MTKDSCELRVASCEEEARGEKREARDVLPHESTNDLVPDNSDVRFANLASRFSPLVSQPNRPLAELFPRPWRAFSWNRMRKQLQKDGYEVPKLRQNPTIDCLVWWGFTPFMYSCITVFIFGLLLFVGIHQPVGSVTPYIEGICIGIIVLYVLFLVLVTGIEFLFGLYVFPEGLETTDDLIEAIKKKEEEKENE